MKNYSMDLPIQWSRKIHTVGIIAACVILILSACTAQATPSPTVNTDEIRTQSAQTVVADLTENAPPPATKAPSSTTAPTPTQGPTATVLASAMPGSVESSNIPVAVSPIPASGDPTAVANFNTLVFSGPGEDYVVYFAFLGGQKAIVTGKSEDGKWWAISVPLAPTGNGWVSGEMVNVTNASAVPVLPTPPVPPTTDVVPPGPDDPQLTTLVNTFVRNGPGDSFPAYGVVPAGKTARVIGISADGEWYTIRINPAVVGAGYGWVDKAFVQAQNVEELQVVAAPAAPAQIPPSAPPSGAPTATAVEYVNIRTGPGTNYPALGVAAPGATAEIAGKSSDGQWWQIKVPAQYAADSLAWVSASYVYTVNADNVAVAEAPPLPPVVDPEKPINTGNCTLLSQTPEDETKLDPDTSFATTWVLQNNGAEGWTTTDYDIRYLGAYNNVMMHQGPDVYDLPAQIDPSWNVPVSVPMLTPSEAGTYAEGWAITKGNEVVCPFYVVVVVK